MSEERNPIPAWMAHPMVHLYIASAGSLFLAAICLYGGITLTEPIRFAYVITGVALSSPPTPAGHSPVSL